ncbi:MAG: type II toxin-antitoxin system prevent-host-death family antitoxin [Alphaproteobacteria bacterium]|nr:type II toxin-antitoxin system prevent-host-death family antitoxin [Alphaproteobacteria bacterium]
MQDAKAQLSEVVRRARSEGPQRVTTRGADPVVVLAEEEYERLVRQDHRRPKLSEILRGSPLAELDLVRELDYGRDVDLA